MLLVLVRVVLTRKSLLRSSNSEEERRLRRRGGGGLSGLRTTTSSSAKGLVDLSSTSGWGDGESEKAESDPLLAECGFRVCFIPPPDSVNSTPIVQSHREVTDGYVMFKFNRG